MCCNSQKTMRDAKDSSVQYPAMGVALYRWGVMAQTVYIHFGPWSFRSLVTSVLGPICTSISVLSQFGPRSFRS